MHQGTPAASIAIPPILYGTAWKEDRTTALTRLALQSGFVGIDTANQRKHYHEQAVGEALALEIARGLRTREQLFLQTKFTYARGQDHRLPYDPKADYGTQVAQSVASSLTHLSTSYIDSYVLHGPETAGPITAADREVWQAMEAHVRAGTIRHLGVSNVTLEQLASLTELSTIKPVVVQNRCYARDGWDRDVRAFCFEHGIVYQGFSLLTANQRELKHRDVESIRRRTGYTTATLVFAFARARGIVPLTGTSSAAHMVEDLSALSVRLDEEDLRALEWIALS